MSACVSEYFITGRAVVILSAGNTALVVIGVGGFRFQNREASRATHGICAGGSLSIGIVPQLFCLYVVANNTIFAVQAIGFLYVEGVCEYRREHPVAGR